MSVEIYGNGKVSKPLIEQFIQLKCVFIIQYHKVSSVKMLLFDGKERKNKPQIGQLIKLLLNGIWPIGVIINAEE